MAKNYRLFVNSFKVGLFFIIIFLLIIIIKASKEESSNEELSSSGRNLSTERNDRSFKPLEATEASVDHLSFSSQTHNNEPYNILAKHGIKTDKGNYYLSEVQTKLSLKDGQVSILAKDGKYQASKDILDLNKNVSLNFNDYSINSEKVLINLNSNDFIATINVKAKKDNIEIKAEKLEGNKDNQKLLFHGKVQSIINFGK